MMGKPTEARRGPRSPRGTKPPAKRPTRSGGPPEPATGTIDDGVVGRELVTIRFFWETMMGRKHRSWFYRHLKKDPGFPQPVPLEDGQSMLVWSECKAYIDGLVAAARGEKKRGP